MKRQLTLLLVAGIGLAAHPGVSMAGPNANAKLLLHLAGTTTKNACGIRATPRCADVVTNGALYPALYFAYLVVADGNAPAGVGGLQCGITYPGGTASGGGNSPINVFSWSLCATLEFSSTGWPAPGGGNLMTWDVSSKCQRFEPGGAGTGVVAAAGYFYVAAYAQGRMALTTRPVDGMAKVADCVSNEDLIATTNGDFQLGYAEFSAGGSVPGYNPCGGGSPSLCHVLGPTSVGAGQTGIVYTVDPSDVQPSGYWIIGGNGVIDTSNTSSATVHATGPGTFNIGYQLFSGCVEGCGCGQEVTVHGPTAVEPTSWSRLKALYTGSN